MKKLVALFAITGSVGFSQLITGFGSDFIITWPGFDTVVQDSESIYISGNDTQSIYGNLVTPVTLSTTIPTALTLTGTLTVNPSTIFQIELFDEDGDSILYQSNWIYFLPLGTEVSVDLSFVVETGTFNGTVTLLGLLTGGPASNLSFTMNTLSAVPEPSSYAVLFGLSVIGFAVTRRRRVR